MSLIIIIIILIILIKIIFIIIIIFTFIFVIILILVIYGVWVSVRVCVCGCGNYNYNYNYNYDYNYNYNHNYNYNYNFHTRTPSTQTHTPTHAATPTPTRPHTRSDTHTHTPTHTHTHNTHTHHTPDTHTQIISISTGPCFFFGWGESVAGRRPAMPSKKHGLHCAFVLFPASFLTFGKVKPGPPQTDIFFGCGPSPPPPSFLSAPAPLRLTFLERGGSKHNPTFTSCWLHAANLGALFQARGSKGCRVPTGGSNPIVPVRVLATSAAADKNGVLGSSSSETNQSATGVLTLKADPYPTTPCNQWHGCCGPRLLLINGNLEDCA